MTNETHSDPQIAEFVTNVLDMAPEAPTFPETVVAAVPPVPRRFAPWMWAPLAAAAAVLVIAPIALRGGPDDEAGDLPFGSQQEEAVAQASDASTDPIPGADPVVPMVDGERNVLSLSTTVVAPGGTIVIDFSGEDVNTSRSDLFWMDRFDYGEQQWFAEWILWSDRSDAGARFAAAASTSVIVPPLDIVVEGYDTLVLPTNLPLGTYRVCIGTTDGDCGVFEISDEAFEMADPGDTPIELVDVPTAHASFGHVVLDPSSVSVMLTPAQWLTGPDAVLVARADGVIGPEDELPNGFYLREIPAAAVVELEVAPEASVILVDSEDASPQRQLLVTEWALELQGSNAVPAFPIFFHVTYDSDGRILTLTQQYIP